MGTAGLTLILNTSDSDRYDARKTALLKIYVYITYTAKQGSCSAQQPLKDRGNVDWT
jgi:hypothetical protein